MMRLPPGEDACEELNMADEHVTAEIVGETAIVQEAVFDALRECYDPEIPVNIVDLGLIYHVRIEGSAVAITMTLTSIGCPVGPEVMAEVEGRVREVAGVENCDVTLTYDPPWTPERMTEDARWELGIG
jgi:metal-sulfur cluster biosynthetic enzyme